MRAQASGIFSHSAGWSDRGQVSLNYTALTSLDGCVDLTGVSFCRTGPGVGALIAIEYLFCSVHKRTYRWCMLVATRANCEGFGNDVFVGEGEFVRARFVDVFDFGRHADSESRDDGVTDTFTVDF